jgi:protein-tyrosine phosphatase
MMRSWRGDPHNPTRIADSELGLREGISLHVLFVCTGNICRSPTAERLAAAFGAQLALPDFTTSSAGIQAVVGHPIHRDAALVLEGLGGDSSNFAARQLTPKIASGADLVLTMTRSHRDSVLERVPRLLHRSFTLSEAARLVTEGGAATVSDLPGLRAQITANDAMDVPDPIGQDPDVFEAVGSQIANLLEPIVDLCRRSLVR